MKPFALFLFYPQIPHPSSVLFSFLPTISQGHLSPDEAGRGWTIILLYKKAFFRRPCRGSKERRRSMIEARGEGKISPRIRGPPQCQTVPEPVCRANLDYRLVILLLFSVTNFLLPRCFFRPNFICSSSIIIVHYSSLGNAGFSRWCS